MLDDFRAHGVRTVVGRRRAGSSRSSQLVKIGSLERTDGVYILLSIGVVDQTQFSFRVPPPLSREHPNEEHRCLHHGLLFAYQTKE